MKKLQSPLIAFILGVILYLATTAAVWKFPQPASETESAEAGEQGVHVQEGPSWSFKNPEIEQLVSELQIEKKALGFRQEQLNELAGQLQSQQNDLMQLTQKIAVMQRDFDNSVVQVREAEKENVKKLAKGYALMDPAAAAKILHTIEDKQVVKILKLMKEAESAPILEAFSRLGEEETKKAGKLTDDMRLAILETNTTSKATSKTKPK